MADALLEFDAAASNIDGTNPGSALSVWNTASYMVTAFNPDAAQQSVQWASSVDTEGSLPASFKDENRTISLTVECLSAAALRALQAKVTKVSSERGTLKYTLPNSEVVIFDLLARASFVPEFDVKYFIHSGAYCTVTMSFIALPSGRGPEVDLGDNVETTLPFLIFTDTGVKGDMPGLGRLLIDEDQGENQKTVFWGIQSRYYSSASTAALFYQGEAFSPTGTGAVATGAGTVSGGASNNTIADLSLTGTLGSFAVLTGLTHVGTFRLLARVRTSNAGTISLGARWTLRQGSATRNDAVSISNGYTGAWHLIDLGQIIASKPTKGSQSLQLELEASSTSAGDDIYVDWVALIPVDEGSGVAFAPSGSNVYPLIASGHAELRHDAYEFGDATSTYWGRPAYEGDYLKIPPAGAEARTLRVFLKGSRSVQDATTPQIFVSDTAIDDISARLFYTPRYLVVPEP